MLFSGRKDIAAQDNIKKYIKSKPFQKLLILAVTVLVAFVIIETGAAPKKYMLNLGDKSSYDIIAPRDIVNKVKTEEKAKAASDAVQPVMKDISTAAIDVLVKSDDFFTSMVEAERKNVDRAVKEKGINVNDTGYKSTLEAEQTAAIIRLNDLIKKIGVPLSNDQMYYLISKANDDEISKFKKVTKDIISSIMMENITSDNLAEAVNRAQNAFQDKDLNQDLINIGGLLVKAILKPNKTVDLEMTKKQKDEAYERPENTVRIYKDERIISLGETVTEDKFEILRELNLLETTRRFDYALAASLLTILLMLAAILIVYISLFSKGILYSRNDIILLSVIILLTLLIARA